MLIYRKSEKTITGSLNGKPFLLPKTDSIINALESIKEVDNQEEALEALVTSSRKTTIAGSNEFLMYNPATGSYYLVFEKQVSKYAIPQTLVDYIEESFDKDIDFMPVIKAWGRFLNNPRIDEAMIRYFNTYLSTTHTDKDMVDKLMEDGYTKEEAVNLSTYPDIAITQEGMLATYKVADMVTWEYMMVKNEETGNYEKIKNPKYEKIPAKLDPTTGEVLEPERMQYPNYKEELLFTPAVYKSGDKFYSGEKLGYVYQVGKVQRLPKNALRELTHTFGGGGLYIGGLSYIEGYHHPGKTHVLTCFVNPGDILSFQDGGSAFRTDALQPNNVWDDNVQLKGKYHSSDYAKLSEDRLDSIIQGAVSGDFDTFREYQQHINDSRAEGEELMEDDDDSSDD